MSFDISRLQDPPMPSYSFSVYHLDIFEKSKFKDYESLLTNRLAQDHARATYLASKFKYRDTEIKKETDFQEKYMHNWSKIHNQVLKVAPTSYYQSHYVALFMLGSERIRNYLLIDTGSYLVWWQCAPCVADKCFKQVFNTIYNRTTSKTFKRLYCVEDSSVCISGDPHFHCALSSSLCFYETTYGSGQTTKGFMQSEVITFPSDNTQARINFGCSIDQKSGAQDFSGTFSGIAGLGRRIVINDKVVPVDPSWWNNDNQGVIVDTGTLITRFPHDFYIIFRDVFRLEVKDYEIVEDGVGPFDTCYKDDPFGAELYFPVVRFYFGNFSPSQELMLVQERAVIENAGYYCLGFFGWNHNFSIIGTNQLQGTGLTFDTKNNVLTFSVDACD
uniref:Protein ASPARTIC PROTEASE IN GUARD CELL 2-like n=1 Tax=Nicotiana tabacum TaxID=4097 RepID=A0A1S4CN95_TOBAC|nr:PREDICTED: protein ASPARTIC PROTEASE IN GUARD CELL 2-like [Nicotiana tabacum]